MDVDAVQGKGVFSLHKERHYIDLFDLLVCSQIENESEYYAIVDFLICN